jgi:hypothetical protein
LLGKYDAYERVSEREARQAHGFVSAVPQRRREPVRAAYQYGDGTRLLTPVGEALR